MKKRNKIFERVVCDNEVGLWIHYYFFGRHIGTKIKKVYSREK